MIVMMGEAFYLLFNLFWVKLVDEIEMEMQRNEHFEEKWNKAKKKKKFSDSFCCKCKKKTITTIM